MKHLFQVIHYPIKKFAVAFFCCAVLQFPVDAFEFLIDFGQKVLGGHHGRNLPADRSEIRELHHLTWLELSVP